MFDSNGRSEFEAPRPGRWIGIGMVLVFSSLAVMNAPAQTFTTLYSFCPQTNCADGTTPSAALIQATNGSLYGSTLSGGTNNDGTLFRLGTSGQVTTLYSFCAAGGACPDGFLPDAPLVLGSDGNFYGTTKQGGPNGGGAFFNLSLSGSLTTIGGFGAAGGPSEPLGLALGANGTFYGTTSRGGYRERGTVFSITPQGTVTTLYDFCLTSYCGAGGAFPQAGLAQGTGGEFYGTTTQGGAGVNCPGGSKAGCGTIFRVSPLGGLTKLYDFCSEARCADGFDPVAPMIQGTDGSFYGTTAQGGLNNCAVLGSGDYGCGTIFKIGPSGYSVLYRFCPRVGCTDGAVPAAALVQGNDGNFYGTAALGGARGEGTIFKITPAGTFTLLHTFCSQSGCADGAEPTAALIQDTNGKFYGTTILGGTSTACPSGCGTAFSFSVGLGEFVLPQPNSGSIGTPINILGTALGGATGVTFNGTPATFTVSSNSLITTTVPLGATSGEVDVVTPHGTIQSNGKFRVVQ